MVSKMKTKSPEFVREFKSFDLQDLLENMIGVIVFCAAWLINPATWTIVDTIAPETIIGVLLATVAGAVTYFTSILYQEYELKESFLTAVVRIGITLFASVVVVSVFMLLTEVITLETSTTIFLKRIAAASVASAPAGAAFNLLMKK